MSNPLPLSDRSPAMDRDRRERLGVSLDDVAARAGITAEELTAYEHAKTEADANPSIAMKVGDALDEFERATEVDDNGGDPEAHPT